MEKGDKEMGTQQSKACAMLTCSPFLISTLFSVSVVQPLANGLHMCMC